MKPKVYEPDERDDVRLEVHGRRGSTPSSIAVEVRVAVRASWRVRWRLDVATLRPGAPTFRLGTARSIPTTHVAREGRFERFKPIVDSLVSQAREDFPDLPMKTQSRSGRPRTIDAAKVVELHDQGLNATEIEARGVCTRASVGKTLERAGRRRKRGQYRKDLKEARRRRLESVEKSRPPQPYANRRKTASQPWDEDDRADKAADLAEMMGESWKT